MQPGCTLLLWLYLYRMCQCGLHAVLWWHIGTLMRFLAVEPCSTARLLFASHCTSGTILLTLYSIVWIWWVSRSRPMDFYWPKLLYPTIVFYYISLSLLSVYRLVLWDWGLSTDRVFITLSLSLALPSFNNNNNVDRDCRSNWLAVNHQPLQGSTPWERNLDRQRRATNQECCRGIGSRDLWNTRPPLGNPATHCIN